MKLANNSMFDHFLVTRFNVVVKSPKFKTDKTGSPTTTDEWLTTRFDLFDKYTVPSIKNQTCKNYRWIVLFNSETPEKFKRKIDTYRQSIPQFTPIYVDPTEDSIESLRGYITTNSDREYIITTRIDNDDVIHRDYLKRVQEVFRPSKNRFISFIHGLQYSEGLRSMRRYNFIRNHYVSRIEKREGVKSVMCQHTLIHQEGALSIYTDANMWVEVVHGCNVHNKERIRPDINIADTEALYGVNLEHKAAKRSVGQFVLNIKIDIMSIVERAKCCRAQVRYYLRRSQ